MKGSSPDSVGKCHAGLGRLLQYLDAQGPTAAQPNGQAVTFAPLQLLEAGGIVEWTRQARVTGAGDVRTRAVLGSDYLRSPVPSVEPTRRIRERGTTPTQGKCARRWCRSTLAGPRRRSLP